MTGKGFSPYVFRTGRTSVQDALAMGAALTKMGKTFVQIAPDYAFGYGGAAAYYGVIKSLGGKFAINDNPDQNGAIYIPIDAKDPTPYLQKVLDSKADVLAVTWSGASIVPLMTQIQQLGVTKTMTAAIGFPDTPTLKAGYAGMDADKLIKVYETNFSFDGPKGKYTVRPYDHVMLQTLYLTKLNNVTDPDVNFYTLLQEVKPEDTAPPCALEGDYKSRCPAK